MSGRSVMSQGGIGVRAVAFAVAAAIAGCDKMDGMPVDGLDDTCTDEECESDEVDAMGDEDEIPPVDVDPDPLYAERATEALLAWAIELEAGQMMALRHLGDAYTAHNPPNWITVADETCDAEGVSEQMRAACPLGGDIIGVCETRFYADTGEIVDTTLVVLDAFQESAAREEDKRAVFIHEVGHCLGLRHSDSMDRVMYPTTAGADAPSQAEQHAVQSAYYPQVHAPAPGIAAQFYATTQAGEALRHFQTPVFVLSGFMGTEPGRSYIPPATGRPLRGEVVTSRHLIRRDGGCEGR